MPDFCDRLVDAELQERKAGLRSTLRACLGFLSCLKGRTTAGEHAPNERHACGCQWQVPGIKCYVSKSNNIPKVLARHASLPGLPRLRCKSQDGLDWIRL